MSSRREQIIQAIVTALEGASRADGYNNNLSGRVDRGIKHWEECTDFPRLFVVDGEETKEAGPNPYLTCTLTVNIWGYENSASDAQRRLSDLLQDTEKVLCADITLGGLALYLEPRTISTDEGWLAPYAVFQFQFMVMYRHEFGSP